MRFVKSCCPLSAAFSSGTFLRKTSVQVYNTCQRIQPLHVASRSLLVCSRPAGGWLAAPWGCFPAGQGARFSGRLRLWGPAPRPQLGAHRTHSAPQSPFQQPEGEEGGGGGRGSPLTASRSASPPGASGPRASVWTLGRQRDPGASGGSRGPREPPARGVTDTDAGSAKNFGATGNSWRGEAGS